MRTVHLTDEGFAEIAHAHEEMGRVLLETVDQLAARACDAQDIEAWLEEQAKFKRLVSAARELHGISTWRSTPRANTFPPGSIFEQPRA